MNHVRTWGACSRTTLQQALPQSLVVLPIGAVEQHGPTMPTATDILISEHVSAAAASRAVERGSVPILLAPALPLGCSAHHLLFGGTLSLRSTTMLAMLEDVIDSIEAQGGRRLLIVNGHGGNRGVARAAASGADARESITVAAVDYWDCAPGAVPGHAGQVEASLVMAIAPGLMTEPMTPRDAIPEVPTIGPASFHGKWLWESLDGFTDDPSRATAHEGLTYLDAVVDGLADLMLSFGRLPT